MSPPTHERICAGLSLAVQPSRGSIFRMVRSILAVEMHLCCPRPAPLQVDLLSVGRSNAPLFVVWDQPLMNRPVGRVSPIFVLVAIEGIVPPCAASGLSK